MNDLLFDAPMQSRETDERYTPAWVFEALGESFDLDPASPPLGVSQVPTAAVWTKDDDGLTKPWRGFVWCNPPFSIATPWADRFMDPRACAYYTRTGGPIMTAICTHLLGPLPCTNAEPHKGDGLGCTHDSGSWVPDRHDKPGRGDGE